MDSSVLTHGSLFSGIGGFDLAAHWMGWDNIFNCEIDPFCRTVLRHYFPKAIGYGDIKETEFWRHRGQVDVLSGGFPCQPFSIAGKRLGTADERHLWPYMLGAIRQIRPRWVVGENVRGIISWNEGLVFEEVCADLEAEGYEVQAYVLPAAGINAPHQRQRVWFVAHAAGLRGGACHGKATDARGGEAEKHLSRRGALRDQDPATGGTRLATDAARLRCGPGSRDRKTRPVPADQWPAEEGQQEREVGKRGPGKTVTVATHTGCPGRQRPAAYGSPEGQGAACRPGEGLPARRGRGKNWEDFPQTEPVIRFGDDGVPAPVDLAAFFEGITTGGLCLPFNRWRTESIRALGNAIVPQLAYRIFRTIGRIAGNQKP